MDHEGKWRDEHNGGGGGEGTTPLSKRKEGAMKGGWRLEVGV